MTPPSRLDRHLKLIASPYGKSRTPTLVIVLAGLLLASMLTAGPASHPAYARTADSSIEFAENGTGPVGVFVAYDQDGDSIVWSLSGPDGRLFTIDGGVLAFREPPDHEDPQSVQRGNVYRVTVEASGGAHDVAVTVTDVDEAGSVRIDRPQPQVDRPLGARLSDEDEGVVVQRWQWARSWDGAAWTDIEGATSPRRSPTPDDVGMYLRATVTYSDKFGRGKTAWAVSANRVEARTLANAAPSFADQDDDEDTPHIDVARSVPEHTPVGTAVDRTVSATDADQDILFYELLDTPDLEDDDGHARFTIDSLSGQLRVGRELGADAGEREDEDSTALSGIGALPGGEEAPDPGNSEYVLRVRVSDPSTASATVNVIVTVTGVNEPPAFDEDAPTALRVRENADSPVITFGESDTPVDFNTYAVTDQDGSVGGPHPYDDTSYTYSVSGPDSDVLAFDGAGALSFRAEHKPDYEEQSSYSITVVASSGEGHRRLTVSLDVTIQVVDAEDVGEIILSQRQPQVGKVVHATVSDPDGGVTVTRWVWERSEEIGVGEDGAPTAECRHDHDIPGIGVVGDWTPIDGASSSVYTTRPADIGRCLRVTATYRDDMENEAGAADERVTGVVEAPVQARNPANAAPHFVVESDRTSRRVAENARAGQDIGAPVTAHDDDEELLIYTLGGEDAASFDISRNNGQLRTKAPLDHEARSSHTVVVTATDPSGATVGILVTINVNDVDEPARITGPFSIDFAEKGTYPVAAFGAHDQDGDAVRWSLSGPDANRFTIDGGVLAFVEPPHYEEPQSAVEGVSRAEDNVYRVTVEASGGAHDVAVTVTDVDEAGTVSISRPQPQADRPLGASLSEPDDGVTAERWQWARSGDGTAWTDIEGATSPRRTPTLADVGMYLRATVAYTDVFGPDKTASAVSANPVEPRTLFNADPSFAEQDEDEATPYVDAARSVPENTAEGMPIGEPVTATDADEDTLFYDLVDTPDLEDDDGHVRFTIDSLTGQIRVGEELGADAGEREDEDSTALGGGPALPGGEDAGEADNSEYVLRVRVSDPSTASATVNVIVTVTEVNEAPHFVNVNPPTVLRVRENPKDQPVITLEDGETPVPAGTYAVTDQDGSVAGPDGYDDTSYTYSVSGADRRYFTFDSTGVLSFKAGREPDYEERSSYSITVTARSGEDSRRLTATLDVTIDVADTEDAGEISLSQRQPQVGFEIHATLSDPDGGVTITSWEWEWSAEIAVDDGGPLADCGDDPGGWTPLGGAMSAVYAPKPADVGTCLRVTAVYTDDVDAAEQQATGVLEVPVRGRRPPPPDSDPEPEPGFVNAAPAFPDQEPLPEGDQTDRTTREVAENTEPWQSIGDPVWAIDDDGDLLIYTLGGEDAASFDIERNSGQLMTSAPLNYEARSSYTVVVTATDPFGAAASIVVTITVTDEDDPAVITIHEGESDDGP